MKNVPGDPDAPAALLYYADFRDDVQGYEFIYARIKVLSEGGKRYANVEIQLPERTSIGDLQARTIHADGTAFEYTGTPVEKSIASGHGKKLVTRVFTLPDVTVSCILEYKYRLMCERCSHDAIWLLQHELFAVKENFWLRPSTADTRRLSYVSSNLPPGTAPRETPAGIEMQVEKVPAFKPEPLMPPEANFTAQVQFFYGGREIESPEAFWRERGRAWYAKTEHFVGDYQEIRRAAAEIAGNETDPQGKLARLYARAQQTKTLQYLGTGSHQEERPNENVLDVFTRGYGSSDEIAELFTALARAAGFKADLLRASSREERVFDPKLLSESQLRTEIVRVKTSGFDLFLDPGTRFCPFGLVAWPHTSVPALQLDKNGGAFIVVPTATADKTVTHRSADVELKSDGSLEGEITIEFTGNEALQHRLDGLEADQARRNKALEDELRSWLPPTATVNLKDVQGWDSNQEPMLAHFSLRLADFATKSGSRLLIPANLFRSRVVDAFASNVRKYPIYFPYTYEEIDRVMVHTPAGYIPGPLPDGQDTKLAATRFITTRSVNEGQLLTTRGLVVNSIYFQPEQYLSLKNFFNKLRAADEERIVLEEKVTQGPGKSF